MKTYFLIAIFLLSPFLFAQDKELAQAKEDMNEYLDQKIEKIQRAKDCVSSAQSINEVEDCRSLLEEDFDDYQKRVKENRNG